MHNPDFVPATIGGGLLPSTSNASIGGFQSLHVHFSSKQLPPQERRLGELFKEKIAAKEFFYGIELTARSYGKQQTVLDYDSFGTLLPLFTSLVWLGLDYANVANVTAVDAVGMGRRLQSRMVVMPHFTCYRADSKRLDDFLSLNFANVLALRGDQVDAQQQFQHAKELVEYMRGKRGDTISIGVGGYPEGHPESKSMEEDMKFLKEKVDAGADFIITQICFSPESILQFVQRCRDNDINVPIIIGIIVPDSMRALHFVLNIVKAVISEEQLSKYKELKDSPEAFKTYAVENARRTVQMVLDSDANVYGFQFFTMNRFENVKLVVQQILDQNFINVS